MATRRRIKLVPDDCIEALEVRAALYFDKEGDEYVAVDVADSDGEESDAKIHQVLGVLAWAGRIVEDRTK